MTNVQAPRVAKPNALPKSIVFEPRRGTTATAAGGLIVLLFALLPLMSGCRKGEPEATLTEPAPLARVGEAHITEADFAFEIQRRIESGRPIGEPAAVLQALIERQAMLQAAEQSPLFDDPVVRRERENQKLARWLDDALQSEKDRVTVSEPELRAFYEENRAEHTQPERVRLAILFRRLNPKDPSDTRAALADELRAARQAYLDDSAGATREGRIAGFGVIAAEASEDTVSRYRGGDLGWLEKGRTDYRWPAKVLETGFALPPGGVSDVLETEDGLYVVLKTDVREMRVTPFETAAPTLRRRLIRRKQEAVEQAFMQELLQKAAIAINPVKAAALTIPETVSERRPPDLQPLPAPEAAR